MNGTTTPSQNGIRHSPQSLSSLPRSIQERILNLAIESADPVQTQHNRISLCLVNREWYSLMWKSQSYVVDCPRTGTDLLQSLSSYPRPLSLAGLPSRCPKILAITCQGLKEEYQIVYARLLRKCGPGLEGLSCHVHKPTAKLHAAMGTLKGHLHWIELCADAIVPAGCVLE